MTMLKSVAFSLYTAGTVSQDIPAGEYRYRWLDGGGLLTLVLATPDNYSPVSIDDFDFALSRALLYTADLTGSAVKAPAAPGVSSTATISPAAPPTPQPAPRSRMDELADEIKSAENRGDQAALGKLLAELLALSEQREVTVNDLPDTAATRALDDLEAQLTRRS